MNLFEFIFALVALFILEGIRRELSKICRTIAFFHTEIRAGRTRVHVNTNYIEEERYGQA